MDNKSSKMRVLSKRAAPTSSGTALTGAIYGSLMTCSVSLSKKWPLLMLKARSTISPGLWKSLASTFEMNSVEPVLCKASFQLQVIRKRQLLISLRLQVKLQGLLVHCGCLLDEYRR